MREDDNPSLVSRGDSSVANFDERIFGLISRTPD
jgi:hypothetical protein